MTNAKCTRLSNRKLRRPSSRPAATPAWQHGNAKQPRLDRDEVLREIRRTSRRAWKVNAGYHTRSLVESAMYRLKTIFGGKLKNRKLLPQKTESRLRCRILNQFIQLGRPNFQWS